MRDIQEGNEEGGKARLGPNLPTPMSFPAAELDCLFGPSFLLFLGVTGRK